MKELSAMVNTDKASVFYDLFKAQIPAFILHLQNQSQTASNEPQLIYENWEAEFGNIHIWKKLAKNCLEIIVENSDKMWEYKGKFQLLFEDYLAKYTIFWLRSYALQQSHYPKLILGFKLLFE
jgi:hypothetical protein